MIFFLYGPDTYRARQKLKEIQEKYQTTYLHAVHVQYFDCAHTELQDAKNALESISMFEQKKLLIFQNVFANSALEEFLFERRKRLAESMQHIIIFFEAVRLDSSRQARLDARQAENKTKNSSKFFSWLKKNAKQQEFLLLSPAKLKLWISQEFERYNLKATPQAQEVLARAAGSDLWRLSNEIKKIAAWKRSTQTTSIRESDVALLVNSQEEADVFAMVEAVAQKDKKRALNLLYRHLQKGDSPSYLSSMLQYQFRTLLQIRDMAERKLSYGAMLQKTKLHPYVLKKGMQIARNFSLSELKSIYEKLFILEKQLKMGKGEPGGVFDLLFATL
ncbi:MAG: DNA polymerase III subunit delta [Candidatus Wildermuthbacteria bacterium RIFCSPLOWO2_01_FULL_48_29]|uniref:DNA polymerase III subunit delta n=2 Tax=Candidatus Wildermuthiibacteriota TaxID=1817923 RepID=A0A1G2RN34_9BACT|nr:MAG: DNA polymerase III subunit delta [Candidatus Wildermuthbacteria bacterium RIFCSPHIGHO2_01_FULL_48_27b]OHA73908.1 MAG: DNA polymerase III subunit delta [Candidatus Wildermuthbacteria bacterium RIFCSPLOWO2_01_FULL_48_29]